MIPEQGSLNYDKSFSDAINEAYELGKQETLAMVMREIEDMKRVIKKSVDELGRPVSPTEAFEIRGDKGYNQALDTLKQKLSTNTK